MINTLINNLAHWYSIGTVCQKNFRGKNSFQCNYSVYIMWFPAHVHI